MGISDRQASDADRISRLESSVSRLWDRNAELVLTIESLVERLDRIEYMYSSEYGLATVANPPSEPDDDDPLLRDALSPAPKVAKKRGR